MEKQKQMEMQEMQEMGKQGATTPMKKSVRKKSLAREEMTLKSSWTQAKRNASQREDQRKMSYRDQRLWQQRWEWRLVTKRAWTPRWQTALAASSQRWVI